MNRTRLYAGIAIFIALLLASSWIIGHSASAFAVVCAFAVASIIDPYRDNGRLPVMSHIHRIRSFSESLAHISPQSQYEDVTPLIVNAAAKALGTQQAALYTIDSFTGVIECEPTSSVTQDMGNAFLELCGNAISDPARRSAWILDCSSDGCATRSDAVNALAEYGIRYVVAGPIRSDINASGALVAFYDDTTPFDPQMATVIEAIAANVSSTLSFLLSLQQSRFLLDDLAGANQKLSVQATVDGLTGLANHRTMQQTLSDLCRSGKASQVFSLVMVDVDHFKLYNDNYGHQEGDGVLRRVAKVLSSSLRQGDMAARYGGEEFALILKGVNKDNAVRVAERIRRALAEQSYRKGSVTVSMGVAQFPEDANDPGEVIEKADRALYHAKITGRNRVVVWGSQDSRRESDDTPSEASSVKTVMVLQAVSEPYAKAAADSLSASSYKVTACEDLKNAVDMLRRAAYDIALVSQTSLPNGSLKHLNRITSIHPDMPVILISESLPADSNTDALRFGASDVLQKPDHPSEIPLVIERNLERKRIERQRMMQKSTGLLLQAIEALVAAIDAKDHHTAGHSKRVCAFALAIADQLNVSQEDRYALELAAKLHDVGKLALPESALNKDSELTDDEWQAMREHPVLGSKIVGNIDELAYVGTIIRHHHERLDGSGYPDGLQGEAIPYLARIIAVADAYEAMTSKRAHRAPLTPRQAIIELWKQVETGYPTEIVRVLEKHLVDIGEMSSFQ